MITVINLQYVKEKLVSIYRADGPHLSRGASATVRQLLNLRPSPEFERWLETMGIMANGRLTKRAGDPSLFF